MVMLQAGRPGMAFYLLVYRYFFFDWLFRDVNRGSFLERAAAWRFNREMGRYLPVYLRRWVILIVCSVRKLACSEPCRGLVLLRDFHFGRDGDAHRALLAGSQIRLSTVSYHSSWPGSGLHANARSKNASSIAAQGAMPGLALHSFALKSRPVLYCVPPIVNDSSSASGTEAVATGAATSAHT
jgi:hypothetical protein